MSLRWIAVGLALALTPWSARAAAENAPAAARQKSIVVLLLSHGQSDDMLVELFNNSLSSTGRLRLSESASGTDLIARMQITHGARSTTLAVQVIARGGAVLVRTSRTVPAGGSYVDATEEMAREIANAAAGDTPPPPDGVEPAPAPADSVPVVEEEVVRPVRRAKPRKEEPDEDASSDWSHPVLNRLDFVVGLEFGGGPWLAAYSNILTGAKTNFNFDGYAQAFTRSIDTAWHPGLNLHGGWKFLHYGMIEAAFQGSSWSGGGATLAGVRVSGFPLEAFLPERKFDIGIEIGGGYAFVASAPYDMSGSYFTIGLTGEYPLTKLIGLQASYRLFTPFLTKFYVDYKNNITEPVQGFTAYWHTFTVGVNFHFSAEL